LFFLQKTSAFAQTYNESLLGSDSGTKFKTFTIKINPEVPDAGEEVTASLVSVQLNLDASNINWTLNGKTIESGLGKKSVAFTMGGNGEQMTIRADIETIEYGTVSEEKTITPASLDILWEADTYTPPFYKGKALPASQSTIKAIAFPSFSEKNGPISESQIVYRWSRGIDIDEKNSGTGKNIYLFTGGYTYNRDSIELTATSLDKSISAVKRRDVVISTPKILLYQNHPLGGILYEKSIGNSFQLKGGEFTLRTEPYFFSFITRNNNDAAFRWNINGESLEINPDNKSEFTLRSPETGSGSVKLGIEINNIDLFRLQRASKTINLTYSN